MTAASTAALILAARVLKAPHVLHASMVTSDAADADFDDVAFAAGDLAFFVEAAAAPEAALRLGMLYAGNSSLALGSKLLRRVPCDISVAD